MKKKAVLFGLILVFGVSGHVYAAENEDVQAAKIAALEQRLSQLELEPQTQKQQAAVDSTKAEMVEKKQKPAEEKNKYDFKISGDARIRAIDSETNNGYKFDERVRISLEKQLDETTFFKMRALFMDDNEFGTAKDDERARVDMAYFQFNQLSGNKNQSLRVGRYLMSFGSRSSMFGGYDGVEYATGNDRLKFAAGIGDWGANTNVEENYYVTVNYDMSKATNAGLWYMKETDADDGVKDYDMKGVGVKTKLSDTFSIACDYWNNTAMTTGAKDGKWLTIFYKNANYKAPKSYGAQFYYRDVEKGSIPSTLAVSGVEISSLGYKGLGIGFEYVPRKNVKTAFRMAFATKDARTNQSKDNYYRFEVNCIF